MISSALTVSPINKATIMLISRKAGKFSLKRNMYADPPGALLYLMITAE
jgi:hypothetical protein